MDDRLKQRVRDRYAEAARSALGETAEDGGSCCGGGESCCGVAASGGRAALEVDISCGSYTEAERGELPRLAADASLGCGCCELPDCGVPARDQDAGICVCEFERYFDVGQSKVSYHLGKLKAAGLVHEERRGKWSFYSLDRDAAGRLLTETAAHLDGNPGKDG